MAKASKSDPGQYTKPELRDSIKKKVTAEDKGGKPGQWSARKAQLVTNEYKAAGGGFKKKQTASQKSLEDWGAEKWTTADGKKAQRKGGTTRYLPEKAWDKLSDQQKAATNEKKQRGSRSGKQFVSNTAAASKARKTAAKTGSSQTAAPKPKRKAASPSKKRSAPAKKKSSRKATA